MAEHTFARSSDSPAAELQRRRPDVDTSVHHDLAVGTRAPAILIAESEEIPRLTRHTGFGRDLLVFPDSESLRAHDVIMEHRPSLVVLSESFAGTPRGAQLIGRIQTDATLTHCQIRVLSDAGDYLLLVAERVTAGSSSTLEAPGKPLPPQYNGTRAAQRVRIGEGLKVRVNGNPVTLVDLSPTGVQVCLTAMLRPRQRVRLVIVDGPSLFRLKASVVWVAFEPRQAKTRPIAKSGATSIAWLPIPPPISWAYSATKGEAQYRAGLGFLDADPDILEALCVRYRPPERPETAQLGQPSRQLEPDVSPTEPPQTVVEADVRIEKSQKTRRRTASLRKLPSGTPVVIRGRNGEEEAVVLVRVKQTRFIAKDSAGRSVDLAVRDFLRPHLENRPT